MFMVWLSTIGGKLEARYRYAVKVVHNTFPIPANLEQRLVDSVVESGQELLAVRRDHAEVPLSSLYQPDAIPKPLIDAHNAVDLNVDKLFGRRRGRYSPEQRLPVLIQHYKQLLDPSLPLDLPD